MIVMNDADPDLVVRAVLFGAVGTAGQRCTSLRRLFLQRGCAARITEKLVAAYRHIRVGDPAEPGTLMGPLIDSDAVENMLRGLAAIKQQGGEILYGGKRLHGCFVEPTIVKSHAGMPILKEEIFAPVLHLIEFDTLDEAIAMHNDVPQGLSSAIFTDSVTSAVADVHQACAASDCGIVPTVEHRLPAALRSAGRSAAKRDDSEQDVIDRAKRFVESLHAAADGDSELVRRDAAGAGDPVRSSDAAPHG